LYKSIDEDNSPYKNPFDHFLAMYGGYLPSATARWCTGKMKLEPFENEIGETPTISYVGIRGDENREGYISKKENIQSIFPFRKNIWSEDVIKKFLANSNIDFVKTQYKLIAPKGKLEMILQYVEQPISLRFTQKQKVNALLDTDVKLFNKVVFVFLKTTDYPVGKLERFSLIENDEVLGIDDIFKILDDSGVGIPAYYLPIEYEVEINGELKKGTYARSRSGCFFCFFQQKIEWVWLLEQHPTLYEKAIDAYQYAVAINEKFDYAFRNMGDAFIKLKKYKEAIEVLERVLELSIPESVIYEAIGHCLYKLNKFPQARFNYKKAVHLNSTDCKLHYKVAVTYMLEEQWQTALKHLENAMRITRHVPEFNLAMGECHLNLRNYKEAIQHF
jgi:tetratricopeptide (TPR) repeat protein